MGRPPDGDDAPVLATCFDAAFVPHVATALYSAGQSSRVKPRWYLAGDASVDAGTYDDLLGFARDCGIDSRPLAIPDDLVDGLVFPPFVPITWRRHALAEALPDEDRIVHLDADVLVLQDLGPLWSTELEAGHLLGAIAVHRYVDLTPLGLGAKDPYFNAGVLVMDLARMRAEGYLEQMREFVAPPRPPLFFGDQDAINILFAGRLTAIDPRWNGLSSMFLPFAFDNPGWSEDLYYEPEVVERALLSPAIVHFDGMQQIKPWHKRSPHPAAGLYREYRSRTPWPLKSLEGTWRDGVLSRVPSGLQPTVWTTMGRARTRWQQLAGRFAART